MANLKSSKKDVKRAARKAVVNRSVRTSLKTYIRRVREAVAAGDQKQIDSALTLAYKNLDKAAQRGIIHKNQASRRKARIAAFAVKAAQN